MYKYSNNLVLKQVRNARGKTNNKKSWRGGKEREGRCCCYFSNAVRWFVRSFTFLKIMLNYNHTLTIQIINKMI